MLDNESVTVELQVCTVGEMLGAQAKGQTKFRTAHRGSGRILGTRTLIAINMTNAYTRRKAKDYNYVVSYIVL